jgi:hypothetical protein
MLSMKHITVKVHPDSRWAHAINAVSKIKEAENDKRSQGYYVKEQGAAGQGKDGRNNRDEQKMK